MINRIKIAIMFILLVGAGYLLYSIFSPTLENTGITSEIKKDHLQTSQGKRSNLEKKSAKEMNWISASMIWPDQISFHPLIG